MSKIFWNVLKVSPAILGASLLMANSSFAAETKAADEVTSVSQLSTVATSPELGQVTSVSKFSDVQPTDWAFQALQSLVERYGCIAGYPDSTFRGNRAMTRYEFAAGLNACLNRVNELIATATADLVTKEDLAKLQRLQEEFSAELATLRGRVDALEARTSQLESHQFSTTTKLAGEVVFNVNDAFGDKTAVPSGRTSLANGTSNATRDIRSNATLSDRVRLSLNTSFSGKDLLRVRLQARNGVPTNNVTGTNMTRLSTDGDEGNAVNVDQLYYRFPVGKKIVVQVDAADTELNERGFPTYSPFESSARGSISRYGRFSPIYRQGDNSLLNSTSSANGTFNPSPSITVALNPQGKIGANLGFVAKQGNDPAPGAGLIDGSYTAVGQINLKPTKAINVGLTFAHTYEDARSGYKATSASATKRNVSLFDSTGSAIANQPFGNIATSSNNYGVEANIRASKNINLFGWAGYSVATAEASPTVGTNGHVGSKADIFYYAVGLALPDLGKKGSMGGLLFGQAPKVTSSNVNEVVTVVDANGASTTRTRSRIDGGTAYHLEGFYRYALTDNIDVTPGMLVIFNPEHNNDNPTEYVGTLRTTFRF